mmetsp:Transcript_49789/g.131607  ORF Transcript_49789/g.131607 Transcript_49789/m.131607 type:complete len:279 (+) Transcript_49789:1023-1859(+)
MKSLAHRGAGITKRKVNQAPGLNFLSIVLMTRSAAQQSAKSAKRTAYVFRRAPMRVMPVTFRFSQNRSEAFSARRIRNACVPRNLGLLLRNPLRHGTSHAKYSPQVSHCSTHCRCWFCCRSTAMAHPVPGRAARRVWSVAMGAILSSSSFSSCCFARASVASARASFASVTPAQSLFRSSMSKPTTTCTTSVRLARAFFIRKTLISSSSVASFGRPSMKSPKSYGSTSFESTSALRVSCLRENCAVAKPLRATAAAAQAAGTDDGQASGPRLPGVSHQ